MGNCGGAPKTEQERQDEERSKKLEKLLKDEKDVYYSAFRLLLLGTGDSGKSTFLRQIVHIHGAGLDGEKEQFKYVLNDNLVDSIRGFLMFLLHYDDIELSQDEIEEFREILECEELTKGMAKKIKKMSKNKRLMDVYRMNESLMQIPSGSKYYWQNAVRIVAPDYSPTKDDIIRSKLITIGVNEISININNSQFTIVDVGGQRSERSKWLHAFDQVNVIIFLCAIDEYDGKKLLEDNVTDRYLESTNLFAKLTGSRWLNNIPFIVFLNKSDIFTDKIVNTPLSSLPERYPTYEEDIIEIENKFGPLSEVEKGLKFFQKEFEERYRGNRTVSVHGTCAVDTGQCKIIFGLVLQSITSSSLWTEGI